MIALSQEAVQVNPGSKVKSPDLRLRRRMSMKSCPSVPFKRGSSTDLPLNLSTQVLSVSVSEVRMG